MTAILLCHVKNAAALLAAHDLVSTFGVHRCLCRHFHVATGSNTVLDRDHRHITLAGK